ncbi:hypothetical protein Tco_0628330 [Tanacetum coccineum]|uniref:Uncharacterized protein n=1 Tax=Tanacetum coccineum TaxID=301880 RepID=A0ABQ4WQ45_9ASTR
MKMKILLKLLTTKKQEKRDVVCVRLALLQPWSEASRSLARSSYLSDLDTQGKVGVAVSGGGCKKSLSMWCVSLEHAWAFLEIPTQWDALKWTVYLPISRTRPIRNSMAPKSIAAISHDEREELRKKGIKSPSKLLSPKYLSPTSIKELNKNPSSPNAFISTDMEVDEVIEEESKFETDEEVEEILEEEEDDGDGENFNLFPIMKELTHHEWLLKNHRPPWVKARIRAGSPNNIKISCMVGHHFKRHAYIDLESPINIMSRHQYNQIMTYGLRSRQTIVKPQ